MIVRSGSKFVVESHKGKRLSKPMSREAAQRRLQQVEYFKHMRSKGDKNKTS